MKKIFFVSLLFISLNLFADSVATVLFTEDKVVAKNNGATRVLSRGSKLSIGDEVVTSDKGKVNIKYSNGTLVNLGSGSHYTILNYSPKQSEVQINADLSAGSLSSKTTGNSKEELRTPVVALAILGTEYNVAVFDRRTTYINVIEGSVMANGMTLGPNSNVVVTPSGIQNATFPSTSSSPQPVSSSSPSSGSTTTTTTSTSSVAATSVSNISTGVSSSVSTTSVQSAPVVSNITISISGCISPI